MRTVVTIVGPTASGKTEASLEIARAHNGVVLNADSTQVYKGMNIGTAKIPLLEIGTHPFLVQVDQHLNNRTNKMKVEEFIYDGVSHYLFDLVNPNVAFNVALYQKLAYHIIDALHALGKLPIFVGGTGLYTKAVLENYQFTDTPDKKLRMRLKRKSLAELQSMLKSLDPVAIETIDYKNPVRLMRAIEIVTSTKKPLAESQIKGKKPYQAIQIGISPPRKELYTRIEERVHEQLNEGLEKEVKHLSTEYGWDSALGRTIAYREWKDYLAGNDGTRDQAIRDIIKDNKAYARRQLTWFNAEKDIRWYEDPLDIDVEKLLN